MKTRVFAPAVLVFTTWIGTTASASGLDSVKDKASGLMGSHSSAMQSGGGVASALGSGSFGLGSMQNAAGVLGYCQKQGYLEGPKARIKDRLMDKIGEASQAQQSEGYQRGMTGVVQNEAGSNFSLANVKSKIGARVCNSVADKAASSFLGGSQ